MNAVEELKKIGIKKISEKTHITPDSVKAILERDFDRLQSIKVIGFIKIIERDFKVDLSDTLKAFEEYREGNDEIENLEDVLKSVEDEGESEKKSNLNKYIYILVLVLAVAGFIFYQNSLKVHKSPANETNSIKEVQETLETTQETYREEIIEVKEQNLTEDNLTEDNSSEAIVEAPVEEDVEDSVIKDEFYVIPEYKVWIGVIYLDNYQKLSTATVDRFDLNSSKDQLIAFGHEKIKLYLNGERIQLKEQGVGRFLYRDGELKEITFREFREYNRGKNW
jgi:hypothetical protein